MLMALALWWLHEPHIVALLVPFEVNVAVSGAVVTPGTLISMN